MSARDGALYSVYRTATRLLTPAAPLLLNYRRSRGKEEQARMDERLGLPGLLRPQGALVWLHGASVGESLSLLPLVEKLVARDARVLMTTGTTSSADILKARLPSGAAHQYVPLDAPRFLRRFLDHWRPDLVLVAESELWPNFLHETHARGVPVALVNARLSQRSFERWLRAQGLIGAMLSRVDLCLAQTHDDAARFARLGARNVRVAGNLKYDAPPPPADPAEVARLRALIGARPAWVAASTHEGEEAVVADAHTRLAPHAPGLLTIVAPRHAARGPEIAALFEARGIVTALRSKGESIEARTQCYVADTMGEMGLFYRAASVVFLGKSIGAAAGGHNPIEPAKLGAAVLHGPNVANFAEVFAALDAAQGALAVDGAGLLAGALAHLFANPAELRRMTSAAESTVAQFTGATAAVMHALEPYLLQILVGSR